MERVTVAPGLISEDSEECELMAARCASCGVSFFPKRDSCLECDGSEMEDIKVSGKGTLYTYTIVNMPSAHYAAPYAIGWIEFPGGLRVFGQIRIRGTERLRIGMTMRMLKGMLWEEDDKEVIGYFFEPAERAVENGQGIEG